jgi:hypothetical protein
MTEQIESGAVQAIRERYGLSEHRILTQDFRGDKEEFLCFFSVPAPVSKKRNHADDSTSQERFRSFRKIVEAIPWCEEDLVAQREKEQYTSPDE